MTEPIDPTAALTQEQFGPYVVFERLGVGGMATVHRAKQRGFEGIERIVALKRLLPHLAEDATFIKSFVREAKLALMLQHANVVQLFELGKVGNVYFIAMEYIDGRDIRRILRQARKASGPPTINVTLSLLIQTCEALEYAHTKTTDEGEPLGLVHRDVSPSNLMVTRSGHVKVIDFGIAKAQSQQLRTQTGRVKGKLAYMAPEAIAGKELDARSDLFSVGVIAHELLTARPLFASKNEYQTLLNVQKSDILPPSAFNQAVPPELDAIVLKALARDPDERYASAAELRDDLHAVRIRYQLSATNREVQAWSDWAFSLEAAGGNFSGPAVTDSLAGISRTPLPLRTAIPARAPSSSELARVRGKSHPGRAGSDEEEAADVAWGGGQEQDTGNPVVLDDVPDYSRHPSALAAMGGEMATSLDAADDRASSTLIGMVAPSGRAATTPSSFPDGSSADAVPKRRGATRVSSVPPPNTLVDVDRTARNERVSSPGFGAAVVERNGAGKALWIALAALTLVAASVGVYFGVLRRSSAPASVAPGKPEITAVTPGTLKFIVEPSDATIKIAGLEAHPGAPWSVQLEPGVVQVKISHDAFQSWETSVELSTAETQTIRVVLAPALAGADANRATLVLDSDPPGLTVVLDGKELDRKTPVTVPVDAGSHTIALRQAGEILWRQHFVAEARTQYEFAPSMSDIKRREREEREARVAAAVPRERAHPTTTVAPSLPSVVTPPIASGSAAPGSAGSGSAAPAKLPVAVTTGSAARPVETPAPLVVAPPTVVKPAVPPVVVAPPVAPRTGPPAVIPPNAVKRTSGELPKIQTIVRPGEEAAVPTSISAKICIDAAGTVTSVNIYKVTGTVATKLASAIKTWRFTTHKVDGKAVPACFVNTFAMAK